jgi:hypothetical protein
MTVGASAVSGEEKGVVVMDEKVGFGEESGASMVTKLADGQKSVSMEIWE